MNKFDFKGRVAVVTGAARGLGLAITERLLDSMIEQTPMGRMAGADELSSMVAWMCSEECSFTTGGVFDISGGRATC